MVRGVRFVLEETLYPSLAVQREGRSTVRESRTLGKEERGPEVVLKIVFINGDP